MANSWQGEIYFRISKHLGITMSEVIRKKFNPDIKLLIMKYHKQLLMEKEHAEEMQRQNEEIKNQS